MNTRTSSALTADAVKDQISRILPSIDQHEEIVEHVSKDELRIRMPFRDTYMGADEWQDTGEGVFSGPALMGLADTTMYGCVHGTYGHDVVTVMQSLNIVFLRPAKAADLTAEARIIRHGKRSLYLECYVRSEGDTAPVAHVTSTYTLRHLPI